MQMLHIDGKIIGLFTDTSTPEQIAKWLREDLENRSPQLKLNEAWSCTVDVRSPMEIVISGDEDYQELALITLQPTDTSNL